MSLIGGNSVQPDRETAARTSSGEPQELQLARVTSEDACPHQGHW